MADATAAEPVGCYSIPVLLEKEQAVDQQGNPIQETDGKPRYRCGFRMGGGIDQDPSHSPHRYPDKGIYITHIHDGSPASRCELQLHDKILQVNGKDFTQVTHNQAVETIRKKRVLTMLVCRKGVLSLHKQDNSMAGHTSLPTHPHNAHVYPHYDAQHLRYQPMC